MKTYTDPVREAVKLQIQLDSGSVKSRAELARRLGVSRAKVTQMLNLPKLDCQIQKLMLDLEDTDERLKMLTERRLWQLTKIEEAKYQRKEFRRVIGH